jgi:hypothetical protein
VAETAKELTKRHYTQLSVDVQTKITGRKCCKIQDRVASKERLHVTATQALGKNWLQQDMRIIPLPRA